MKKVYTLVILSFAFTLFTFKANAKLWNVTVNASSFSPNTLPNVMCGDTIKWTLGSGSHTTTSTTIPPGATTWDAPITSTTPTFSYKVPNISGVYNYKCTPHGFTASFTVTCSVDTKESIANASSILYPNPFYSTLTLQYTNKDEIRISNSVGNLVKTILLNKSETKTTLYLENLNPGVYFYSTILDGVIRETKMIVKIN